MHASFHDARRIEIEHRESNGFHWTEITVIHADKTRDSIAIHTAETGLPVPVVFVFRDTPPAPISRPAECHEADPLGGPLGGPFDAEMEQRRLAAYEERLEHDFIDFND